MYNNLFHSANADIKYPLSDTHTSDVPNDLLLDLSISAQVGEDVVLGAVRVHADIVFLSFERAISREAVATLLVNSPRTGVIYPLSMDVDGFGYVVLGDGAFGDYLETSTTIALDPECFLPVRNITPVFSLQVNGVVKEFRNILELLSSESDVLSITIEDNVIYLDRLDDNLSAQEQADLTDSILQDPDVSDSIIYTINGVRPDENGNIDITVLGCIPDCERDYSLEIPRGDEGQGTSGELPLDVFNPRRGDDDPCVDTPGPPPEEVDPCLNVATETILDVQGDIPIGTLYRTLETP